MLLDELTAALGVAQTEQVLQPTRRLREQGLGVVVISHNLANVFDVVDRNFVLRRSAPGAVDVSAEPRGAVWPDARGALGQGH